MSFFRLYWLRRLVRRHTKPIPYRKARNYKQYLSLAYAFFTWNMLGYIAYEYYNGRGTKESYGIKADPIDMLSSSQQYAIRAGIEKAKIVRSKNMYDVEEFRLEDFKEYIPQQKKTNDDGDDDEDNVA